MISGSNYHCSVLVLKKLGVLIEGPSGSGKTSLTLGLLEHVERLGKPASLVCDDQAILKKIGGRVIAYPPRSISGKIEIRGYGIAERPCAEQSEIHLLVQMTDDKEIERLPKHVTKNLLGVELPLIKVPQRHEAGAIRIVLSHLDDLCKCFEFNSSI